MPEIITRAGKGSELSHNELDANFSRETVPATTTFTVLTSHNRSTIEANHATTAFTATLPTVAAAAAVDTTDFRVTFTNINKAVMSIDGNGSETIDGSTSTIDIGQWESVTIQLNNADSAWNTIRDQGMPTGAVIMWTTATVPGGYLECDGASLLRTDYPKLFAVIGVTYGNVDGTHFNAPDLRGQFVRGFDNTAGIDPDAASRTDRGDGTTGDEVGTKQDFAIENITGSMIGVSGDRGVFESATGAFAERNDASGAVPQGSSGNQENGFSFDASRVVNTSTETRPVNVGLMFCIKY